MNHSKQFAPVVPIQIAQHLKKAGVLGKYHLLLAHDVLDKPDLYKEVFASDDNVSYDIIMDNSLIELGKPMEMQDVLQAAHIVGAKKIVLPDVLGDIASTLHHVHKAMEDFRALPLNDTMGIRPVGVVQGSTMTECISCLAQYSRLGLAISIPRVLKEVLGSRMEITAYAHYYHGYDGIHLLGFSDDLIDDVATARLPGVRGIDSAVPIRAGYKKTLISLDDLSFSERVGPRGDYWEQTPETLDEEQLDLAINNIEQFRSWINF